MGEPWILIINDFGEVCIVNQELLNLDLNLSLIVQIQLQTTENGSPSSICQPSLNGTYLQS